MTICRIGSRREKKCRSSSVRRRELYRIQPVVFLVSADEKAGVPVGKPVQKPHHPFGMGEFPGVVTEKQIIADALLFRISKAALQRRIIPVDVRHHGDGQGKNAAAIRICCREKNSFVPHKCSFHS